jgi:hypothetical protein
VSLLDELAAALAPAGLNVFGVARPEALSTVHPAAKSIVVVGSGGRAHWDAFLRYVAEDPAARLAKTQHPLDDFCAAVFAKLDLPRCRVVFPTFRSEIRIDFMTLAERAGLGRRSELGLLVDPQYGPWFALRAAVFTPEEIEPRPLARRMCDGCDAPCLRDLPPGLAVPALHLPARLACIVGPEHAYDELERIYHYDRAQGRRLLCEKFGVRDETA